MDRVEVGDRNVANRMRQLGANIGGESSGHIIFSDFATTGMVYWQLLRSLN